ncbi:MAG: hypothetical protein ACJ73D_06445 [Pyrinomonadaceae bacterium]
MDRRHLYTAVFSIVSVFALAVGGFGQGKGHGGGNSHGGGGGGNPHGDGGGGNPHGDRGGGNPHGRGGDDRRAQQVPQAQPQQHGNPHGNGGPPQRQAWDQQRAVQQQQRAAQQQQWQQQRAAQMQQMQQQRAMQQQQRQNDWNARRQQQEALRQQYRQQPQPQWNDRHDNGRHNGWNDNGPRGNAYGLRGMAPGQMGQNHDWNNWNAAAQQQAQQQQWQQRRDAWRDRRNSSQPYYNNNSQPYYGGSQQSYNYDPLTAWAPGVFRTYNYGGNSGYNGGYYNNPYSNGGYNNYAPNNYAYAPGYSGYYPPQRVSIIRTLIAGFFTPQQDYYTTFNDPYYYGNSGYSSPNYYGYSSPNYYYSNAGYAPAGYYDSGYYDPYSNSVPMFASPFYGDSSLKSSLLNFGVQMLQGFLGQGYNQGLNDARYVRNVAGPVYYDPYQAPEPAYYSPYASSFADQRQVFEDGYRLGYEDAMRNQDPYGAYNNNARVDVVSQFLANSLLGS